jgi:hypothetical protein
MVLLAKPTQSLISRDDGVVKVLGKGQSTTSGYILQGSEASVKGRGAYGMLNKQMPTCTLAIIMKILRIPPEKIQLKAKYVKTKENLLLHIST